LENNAKAMIRSEKIKQISASVLVVLCLFVSSIAACYCEHHQEKVEAENPSCHSQKDESKAEKHHAAEVETSGQSTQVNAPCECLFDSAPKFVAKSENVKIEKQIPLFIAEVETIRGFIAVRAPSSPRFDFASFHITDSFYNIKSPRAPPRL
jgi:hypothetical protein